MASYQEIYTRGQQTDGVWSYFAPTLVFGTLTLAPHQADVAAMPGADQAVVDAEAAIDETRDLRDVKLALVQEIATRLPRLAANSLAPEDSLQDDIVQIQGIVMSSDALIVDRGQASLTLWTGVNARRAAATPPLPVLTLLKAGGGTWAVADLAAALTAIPALEQHVKDAAAPLSEKRSLRRTLAARVDRVNKRWFEAWGAHFPEGTPQHDALSQITTEGGGSGEPAPPPPEPDPIPVPSAPQNFTLQSGPAGSGKVIGNAEPPPAGEIAPLARLYEGGTMVAEGPSFPLEAEGYGSGDPVTLTGRYVNDSGESDPSDTGTAPAG